MARRFELSDEVQDLRDDLGKLRNSVADMLESLISSGRSGATNLRERLSENAEKWTGDLRDAFSVAGKKSRQTVENVHEQIEQRPVTSLLVAFGFGILLGKLLDRR